MKTIAHALRGSTLLLVHSAEPPTKEEWGPYMEAAKKMDADVGGDLDKAGIVVFTDGGAPGVVQRDAINKWLHGRKIRTAVLCHSQFVRGVVAALNWFNKEIRVFSPHLWQEALRHAGVKPADEAAIAHELAQLGASLGGCKTIDQAFRAAPAA